MTSSPTLGQSLGESDDELAPLSGQFEIVRRGRRTGVERTVVRGEPLPPTPKRRDRYRVADSTRNRAGRRG